MANYNSKFTGAEIDARLGLAGKLETMKIEGYSRDGEYTDVTSQATKREGEIVVNFEDSSSFGSVYNVAGSNSYRLDVSEGDKFRVTGVYSPGYAVVYFFNENNTCIGSMPKNPNPNNTKAIYTCEITIPIGGSYIVANEDANNKYFAKIEKYVASEDLNFVTDMTIEGYKREEVYTDITSKATKHTGYYITDSGGKILEKEQSVYDYFELDVIEGEKFIIDALQSPYMHGLYFANTLGNVIEGYPLKEGTEILRFSGEFVVPAGALKLYVNQHAGHKFYAKIQRAQSNNLNFVLDGSNITSHLTGKKLACVGDSITEAIVPNTGATEYFKNYAEIVAERNGMKIYKDGKSGSTITNISNMETGAYRPENSFSIERYMNVPDDFDILTIFFGWNDAEYATLGSISDTDDDTTFYGAYKKVIEYYLTNYPTKKIGLIVPYGNSKVEPFASAVRAISDHYGIPCLDLWNQNTAFRWVNTKAGSTEPEWKQKRWNAEKSGDEDLSFTYDGCHPSQAGYDYLSTIYEAFIQRL